MAEEEGKNNRKRGLGVGRGGGGQHGQRPAATSRSEESKGAASVSAAPQNLISPEKYINT